MGGIILIGECNGCVVNGFAAIVDNGALKSNLTIDGGGEYGQTEQQAEKPVRF